MKPQKILLISAFSAVIVAAIIAFPTPAKSLEMDWSEYEGIKHTGENVLVLKPTLTEAAYGPHGFYYYFDGRCGVECLDIPLQHGESSRWGAWNLKGVWTLNKLGYPAEYDTVIHQRLLQDPDYLDRYDSIILLHNEYVTRELYDAVTSHQNVVYLYPNALYAEVEFDGERIQLIRGHGYPEESTSNGFGWKFDNTPEEYDLKCNDWKFRPLPNGHQLNCMPELVLSKKPEIMRQVKEFIQ